MCIKGTTGTEPVKTLRTQTCYHCGRIIWEDPRGHIGCLKFRLSWVLMAEQRDMAKNN